MMGYTIISSGTNTMINPPLFIAVTFEPMIHLSKQLYGYNILIGDNKFFGKKYLVKIVNFSGGLWEKKKKTKVPLSRSVMASGI